MAGSDLRWLCCWILFFLISSQFRGFSCSSSLPQHDFQIFRVSKPKEDDIHEIHCSRERSRAAWKIIQEYLTPFVEKEQYQLPTKCRLHRDNDIYREQEEHKEHIDINEWQCGFCKKTFYEEKYLDKHFDNRHHHLLNMSHGRCLADLCGALHCDLVMDSTKRKSKCNPAAAARNRHLCENSSCDNSAMHTLAQEVQNLYLRSPRRQVCSTSLSPSSLCCAYLSFTALSTCTAED